MARTARTSIAWALVACAAALTAAGPLAARTSVGTAYSLEDERVLYRERRVETWRGGELVAAEVDYLTPSGDLFAEKTIRFEAGPTAPEFTYVDHREAFREGARTDADSVELFSGATGEIESRQTELPDSPVIDAGFHGFIQDEFERLAAGERLAFDFAVPAEQRFVRFQIEKIADVDYRGQPAIELRLRPANLFFRLLVDPIRLIYDEERRLREFAGLSDIRDDDGDRYQARIVFEYPGSPSGAVAPSVGTAGR